MEQYYEEAYLDYLIHFHASRDYFECHEIMEEHWLAHERDVKWLTLIQLAVAVYHERQCNWSGSLRLYERTLTHLTNHPQILIDLGIDEYILLEHVKERIRRVKNREAYEPFNLPLTDDELIRQCRERANSLQLTWLSEDSQDEDNPLVYKHKQRDRSEVIQARQEALFKKKKERERR